MSWKDLFRSRRSSPQAEEDSLWLTSSAKLAGLRERVARHAADGQVVVLAHFPATLDAVETVLGDLFGTERGDSEADLAAAIASPETGAICLGLVDQLPPAEVHAFPRGRISFLVAERHPLRAQDERVERLASALLCPSRVRFHLAIDDPLLEHIGKGKLRQLLTHLGIEEDQELTHPTLTSAVERVQKEAAKRARSPIEASSSEEWVRAIEPE